MTQRNLAEYFELVAAKRLTAVEVDPRKSNQHELAAAPEFVDAFGRPSGRHEIQTTVIHFKGDDLEPETSNEILTLYDTRARQKNRSPEYRLYYSAGSAICDANERDLLILAKPPGSSRCLALVAESQSAIHAQLLDLFSVEHLIGSQQTTVTLERTAGPKVDYARSLILQQVGIYVEPPVDLEDHLTVAVERFGGELPSTRVFSEFARSTIPDIDPVGDPDRAVELWMEREEALFTAIDRHQREQLVDEMFMRHGAGEDISDELEKLFLGRQNRRKSRAGLALEHHLSAIFDAHGLRYSHGGTTENDKKPDFLFPGIAEYWDPDFDQPQLTMLGSKRTLKERWRQVFSEAEKIPAKHLFTFESRLSERQADEMRSGELTLVIPASLHGGFSASQRELVISLNDFIELVRSREPRPTTPEA